MKSTGLFGKNSGRVGGVVYSNYRGEQVVRSYQPKVSNPNSARQIEQRAKFKLVSQVGASLGREIKMSFVPSVAKETPRNAFVKEMLKKTVYRNNEASLPIEDIVLTNSHTKGFMQIVVTDQSINGVLTSGFSAVAKVRVVIVGYSDGGEITLLAMVDNNVTQLGGEGAVDPPIYSFTMQTPEVRGYTNVRALVYVYEPDTQAGSTYEDYEVLGENATLQDAVHLFRGRLNFSATENLLVPRSV